MKRRLLIRPGAIGDSIVSLPAMEHLKAEYTEVWTAGQNVSLMRFADRARAIVSTGIDAYPPRLDAFEGFDEIVSWYGANRPEFRDGASRYPIRFLKALPEGSDRHAVDYYMAQVGGPDGAIPHIECRRVEANFIAVHPFSGSTKKNWQQYAEVAEQSPLPVRFCVSPEQSWPHAAVQCENLYELAQWLASATLYVGNDSGITHLAAAVGVPVIAIFQASDPKVWAPRGRAGVTVLNHPTLDEVLATVRTQLQSR